MRLGQGLVSQNPCRSLATSTPFLPSISTISGLASRFFTTTNINHLLLDLPPSNPLLTPLSTPFNPFLYLARPERTSFCSAAVRPVVGYMPSDNSTLYANFHDFDTISNEMGSRISSFHPLTKPVLLSTPILDTDSGSWRRDRE